MNFTEINKSLQEAATLHNYTTFAITWRGILSVIVVLFLITILALVIEVFWLLIGDNIKSLVKPKKKARKYEACKNDRKVRRRLAVVKDKPFKPVGKHGKHAKNKNKP
jgi:Na+-transporting methylmalonyl-CoA/oxaloacetate decarboxylase gamma subunit